MKLSLRVGLALAALSVVGCKIDPAKPLPPPAAGKILTFTATPAAVRPGASTTLSWTTESSTAVLLQQAGGADLTPAGAPVSGSVTVTINAPTVFLLSAQGEGGTDARALAVTIEGGTAAPVLSALPSTIQGGASTTLVWSSEVTPVITEVNGAMVDLKGQTTSGSVQVTPTKSTQYRLTAGAAMATADVKVTPIVTSFGLEGAAPVPGAMARLAWKTKGADKLTVRRIGAAAPLEVVTDAARLESSVFSDAIPSTATVGNEFTYELDAESGSDHAIMRTTVTVGGGVKIVQFNVPEYGLWGSTSSVSWTVTGATALQVLVDNQVVFIASTAAEVSAGTTQIASPQASSVITLVASNGRGDEARKNKTIVGVGALGFNSFTADKVAIDGGGEAVTLSWDVTSARNVRIFEVDGGTGEYRFAGGPSAEVGSVTVYPNQPNTGYQLIADNGATQVYRSAVVNVAVAQPATVQFSRQLPPGGTVNVTGSTVPAATVVGVPSAVEVNPMGESFIDISDTGSLIALNGASSVGISISGLSFDTVVYGRRLRRQTAVQVSIHGFMVFGSTLGTNTGANTPTFGTTLSPLTIAPYWQEMTVGVGDVFAKFDDRAADQCLIIQWNKMQPRTTQQRVTFQAQVCRSGKLVYAYKDFVGVTTSTATVGVVNGSETDELRAPMPASPSSVFRFFAGEAPAPIKVEASTYVARAKLANGALVDIEGDARIPANLFAFSEVMPTPAPAITSGEWVEVRNLTDAGLDLAGWDVEFSPMNTFTIPNGNVIAPFGRLLVAQSASLGDLSTNITANVVYPSMLAMPDVGGTVRMKFQGNEYTSFTYPAGLSAGSSFQIEEGRTPGNAYVSTVTRDTCPATSVLGDAGQFGTPGAANASCLPYALTPLPAANFEQLEGRGLPLMTSVMVCADAGLVLCSSTPLDQTVAYLDAGIPGLRAQGIYVSSNGFLSTAPLTSSYDGNEAVPSTVAPNGVGAVFWDDLQGYPADAGIVSAVYYQRNDTSGYSVVSWENMRFFGVSTPTSLNFQAKIFDDGRIEYHYGPFNMALADGGTPTATDLARLSGNSATALLDSWSGSQALIGFANDAGVPRNGGFVFTRTP